MGKDKQTETNKTVKKMTQPKRKVRDSCWTMERLEVLTVFFFFFYGDVYTGGGVEPMRIGSLPDFNPVFAFD